jgi:Na+-driven multidrug efflux pump
MNSKSTLMTEGPIYKQITVVLYNTASGIFQAVGNSKSPLYYLITSSIINVILDLLFVVVFKMGIAGAAIATVIAQGVSVCLAFSHCLACILRGAGKSTVPMLVMLSCWCII